MRGMRVWLMRLEAQQASSGLTRTSTFPLPLLSFLVLLLHRFDPQCSWRKPSDVPKITQLSSKPSPLSPRALTASAHSSSEVSLSASPAPVGPLNTSYAPSGTSHKPHHARPPLSRAPARNLPHLPPSRILLDLLPPSSPPPFVLPRLPRHSRRRPITPLARRPYQCVVEAGSRRTSRPSSSSTHARVARGYARRLDSQEESVETALDLMKRLPRLTEVRVGEHWIPGLEHAGLRTVQALSGPSSATSVDCADTL
jgi:hypothetical protein